MDLCLKGRVRTSKAGSLCQELVLDLKFGCGFYEVDRDLENMILILPTHFPNYVCQHSPLS